MDDFDMNTVGRATLDLSAEPDISTDMNYVGRLTLAPPPPPTERQQSERNLAQAREAFSTAERTPMAKLKNIVPFKSFMGPERRDAALHIQALKDYDEGKLLTHEQAMRIAAHERGSELAKQAGTGEQILEGISHIPAIALESHGPGLALKSAVKLGMIGQAGATALQEAPFLSKLGLARTAATTALMPSMYAEGAQQRAEENLGSITDLRNLTPALALGFFQTAVLGSLSKIAADVPGLSLGAALKRGAMRTGLGLVEQQGVDVMAGAVNLQTGYGAIPELLSGHAGEGLKQLTVQAVTFAAFAAMHAPNEQAAKKAEHKVMQEFKEQVDTLSSQGWSPEGAAGHLANLKYKTKMAQMAGIDPETLQQPPAPVPPSAGVKPSGPPVQAPTVPPAASEVQASAEKSFAANLAFYGKKKGLSVDSVFNRSIEDTRKSFPDLGPDWLPERMRPQSSGQPVVPPGTTVKSVEEPVVPPGTTVEKPKGKVGLRAEEEDPAEVRAQRIYDKQLPKFGAERALASARAQTVLPDWTPKGAESIAPAAKQGLKEPSLAAEAESHKTSESMEDLASIEDPAERSERAAAALETMMQARGYSQRDRYIIREGLRRGYGDIGGDPIVQGDNPEPITKQAVEQQGNKILAELGVRGRSLSSFSAGGKGDLQRHAEERPGRKKKVGESEEVNESPATVKKILEANNPGLKLTGKRSTWGKQTEDHIKNNLNQEESHQVALEELDGKVLRGEIDEQTAHKGAASLDDTRVKNEAKPTEAQTFPGAEPSPLHPDAGGGVPEGGGPSEARNANQGNERTAAGNAEGTPAAGGGSEAANHGLMKAAEQRTEETMGSGTGGGGSANAVGQTKAAIAASREARGLEHIPPQVPKGMDKAWAEAKEIIAHNPKAGADLIDLLSVKPRAFANDTEVMLALHRRTEVFNEGDKAIYDAEVKRKRLTTPEDIQASAEADRHENALTAELNRIDHIAKASGTEGGRAFNALKAFSESDFTLVRMMAKEQAARGRDLKPEEKTEITDLYNQIKYLKDKLAALGGEDGPAPRGSEKGDLLFKLWLVSGMPKKRIDKINLENLTNVQKVLHNGSEVMEFFKAIMTSIDLPSLRQGAFFALSNPIEWSKTLPDTYRGMVDAKMAFHIEREIRNAPNALNGNDKLMGLDFTKVGGGLTHGEEGFISQWVKKVPFIKQLVEVSERGYVTALNLIRRRHADILVATLAPDGVLGKADAKIIGNAVNAFSGRGDLMQAEKAAGLLTKVFFAPKWFMSRLQVVTGQPIWTTSVQGGGRARAVVAGEYAKMLVGLGTVYAMAKMAFGDDVTIEHDPRGTDFGMLKIGNTRLDMTGKLASTFVFLNRVARGETKNQKGEIVPLRGDNMKYGQRTVSNVIEDFGRGKLAPLPGAIWNVAAKENVVHQPVTPLGLVTLFSNESLITPLYAKDVVQAVQDLGVPRGIALSLVSILGASLNTYEPKGNIGLKPSVTSRPAPANFTTR